MSSFVISKSEYIKAAGTIAGIAENSKWGGCPLVTIYGENPGYKMSSNDFYNFFCECYEMNSISVYDQYKYLLDDCELFTDGNDYIKDFEKYYTIGKNALKDPDKLREIILNLQIFMKSAMYQTEKPEYERRMKNVFYEIIEQLYCIFQDHNKTYSWGRITF